MSAFPVTLLCHFKPEASLPAGGRQGWSGGRRAGEALRSSRQACILATSARGVRLSKHFITGRGCGLSIALGSGSLAPCLAVSKQLLLSKHAVPPARAELGTKPALCPVRRVGGVGFGVRGEFPLWEGVLGEQVFPSSFQGSRLTLKARLPQAGQLQVHWGRESAGHVSLRTFVLCVAAPSWLRPPTVFIHSSSSCGHLG